MNNSWLSAAGKNNQSLLRSIWILKVLLLTPYRPVDNGSILNCKSQSNWFWYFLLLWAQHIFLRQTLGLKAKNLNLELKGVVNKTETQRAVYRLSFSNIEASICLFCWNSARQRRCNTAYKYFTPLITKSYKSKERIHCKGFQNTFTKQLEENK